MKEFSELVQAIFVLIVGVFLFSALGMASLANQIGSLGILIMIVAVIVIIARIVMKFLDDFGFV